jgi:nicotinamide-nucleotide amidase
MHKSTFLAAGLLAVCGSLLAWADPAAPQPHRPVDYRIVITGSELLAGAFPDAHTHFLTRTLRPLNLRCVGSMTVPDMPAEIEDAVRLSLSKAALVIVTGGLGPTDNDVTRESLSAATGIALAEQPEVLAAMERRFQLPRDQLRPNLRRQTRVPTRGTYLRAPNGTAVGLVFELDQGVVVALPGPPRELQPMVHDELVPYLHRRFGTHLPGCVLTLRFVGIGQSQIDHTIKQHLTLPPDVQVSSQFEGGRVDFTFALPGDTPENRQRLDELKQVIQRELGEHLYADDDTTLEQCVARLLTSRNAKLVLAEAGSGGGLSAGLDVVTGADRVLAGAYIAPTADQVRLLLRVPDASWSASTAGLAQTELLATAAADATGSTWAVAVGDVQAGEQDRRYVWVVFKSPGGTDRQQFSLRGTGELARSGLTTQLLDALRRRLRP